MKISYDGIEEKEIIVKLLTEANNVLNDWNGLRDVSILDDDNDRLFREIFNLLPENVKKQHVIYILDLINKCTEKHYVASEDNNDMIYNCLSEDEKYMYYLLLIGNQSKYDKLVSSGYFEQLDIHTEYDKNEKILKIAINQLLKTDTCYKITDRINEEPTNNTILKLAYIYCTNDIDIINNLRNDFNENYIEYEETKFENYLEDIVFINNKVNDLLNMVKVYLAETRKDYIYNACIDDILDFTYVENNIIPFSSLKKRK